MLLRELLGEAQRFPGEVPEETILNQVINTHDAWRLEVRKVLHRKSIKESPRRHQASREDCPSSRDERIRRALATRHRSSALGDTGESESAGIAHASSTGDVDGSGGGVCSDAAHARPQCVSVLA